MYFLTQIFACLQNLRIENEMNVRKSFSPQSIFPSLLDSSKCNSAIGSEERRCFQLSSHEYSAHVTPDNPIVTNYSKVFLVRDINLA